MAGTLVTACGSGSTGTPTINLYNAPQENMTAIVQRCNQQADGRYRIKLNTLPRDADPQRQQLVRRLAAGDSGLDVLGLDVTWTAELAEAGWIRPWTGQNREQAEQGTLAAPLKTAMWQNKLYAAPYNTNVQLLWYRSDLMPDPPSTWHGLSTAAAKLAAEKKAHYVEVQGAQYEGLVVWFNSVVASAGGTILDDGGTKVSLGKPAVEAMRTMRDFARSKAADPSLTNTQEDQARLAVEGGRAVAEVNYPFVYPAMQADKPKLAKVFKWAPYPGIDGPGRSPLGGANFAVSRYSQHPEQAFDAALCLRDPTSQKTAAVKDGLPPTIRSVYDEPEMAKAYPMRGAILKALRTAAPRPVTPTYQNVSTVVSASLSPPASINPTSTEHALHQQIADALQSKGVLP
ncbi:MAG: ABC transporter substrate-binding protein [Actinocatenispora sp.]